MEFVETTQPQTKPCPFCAETIQAPAIKCRFCGEFLNTDKAKALGNNSWQDGQLTEEQSQDEDVLFQGRPSLWSMIGTGIRGMFFFAIAGFLMAYPLESLADDILKLDLTENQAITFSEYCFITGLSLAILVAAVLLLKIAKLKSTYYEITEDRIEWGRGIFDRKIDNLDMFRVIDLQLRKNLLDCVFGIGTVKLITSDKTDPEFTFEKMRKPRKLYDIIKKASLDADRKNSVVHLE